MLRRPSFSIFFTVLGLSLLFSGGHSYSIDEETYLANLKGLAGLETSIPPDAGGIPLVLAERAGGGLTSFYGLGTAIFNMPAYVLGNIVSSIVGEPWGYLSFRTIYFGTNSFAHAITAVLLFRIGIQLSLSSYRSAILSLLYATGTFALVHAKTGFAETLTALFLVAATSSYLKVRMNRKNHWAGAVLGLSLGAALLMRASTAMFLPFFGLALFAASRRLNVLLASLIGFSFPAGLFVLNNWIRFGNPLDTGYPNLQFSTPIYEGIYGLLFSTGKGLVLYAPAIALSAIAIRMAIRVNRELCLLMLICILVNLWFFARFDIWSGDNAFGPRYMAIVLPFFFILLAMRFGSFSLTTITVFWIGGIMTNIGGLLVYFNAVYWDNLQPLIESTSHGAVAVTQPDWMTIRNSINFTPRFSPVVLHLKAIPEATFNFLFRSTELEFQNVSASHLNLQLSLYQSRLRIDTWWNYWRLAQGPTWFYSYLVLQVAATIFGSVNLIRFFRTENTRTD